MGHIKLGFYRSTRISLPEEVTIFTLYADKQLTEQNSSIFPKLLALSTISAEDLRDLHSVQGVILADFCGNTEISFSFQTWHFFVTLEIVANT